MNKLVVDIEWTLLVLGRRYAPNLRDENMDIRLRHTRFGNERRGQGLVCVATERRAIE